MMHIDPILAHVGETSKEAGGKTPRSSWRLYRLAQTAQEDKSFLMIGSVVIVLAVAGTLPMFGWFRDLTGINAWIPLLVSIMVR